MTCPSEQDLTAFVDGELAASRVDDIAGHLADCDACAALVARYRRVGDVVRGAAMDVPTLVAQSRWINAVSLSSDRSVRRLASWMTAAASIVLVATLSMWVSSNAQATPTPLSDWEATAIAGPEAVSDSPHATAQLIALDLSLPSQNGTAR